MPRLKTAALFVPVLIVVLAGGAGGYQAWSQHEARASVNAALASLPAGSSGRYDTLGFNAFTHTLRIDGLVITRDGHPSLTVQDVVLHHLSGGGTLADPFEAGVVRLVNTEIWRGSHRLTVGLLQGQAVEVLAPGVTPPAGLPNWLVSPGSGTLLAAEAITASDIADDKGTTLAALSVAGYDEGQVRQASASGFADRQGNRVASVAAHALDLGGLDAVFDTGRYGNGGPNWAAPRPLIGHAEIMGIQSQDKGVSATVDSVTLDQFAARPFAEAPNTAYVKTKAFLRDAAAAVSVGAASVTGLHTSDDKTKLSGSLSAFSVTGYADGAVSEVSLDDLAVLGNKPAQVAVGHFELIGLTATKLLHEPAGSTTESLIEAASNGGVRLAALALDHVSITPATGHTVTLDLLDQTTTGSAPTRFKLRLRGLSIPAQSNPELAQGLGAIGIDPLVLDLDETGAYDKAQGTASLDPMVLSARSLGSLSLSAQFTNVPLNVPQKGAALDALTGIGIGPFIIRFVNDTLVQRIIAMQARQAGKTPEEVTDEAKLAASFGAATLVPQQPDAGAQVAAFIADPRALTITGTPAAPVILGALLAAGRDAAQSALNLRLSAN